MGNRRSGLGWLPVVCALAVLGMGGGDDTRLADAARVGDIAAVDDLSTPPICTTPRRCTGPCTETTSRW